MRSGNSRQRSFGLINQLPHYFSNSQDLSDSASGLSRPNQRFSTLSPPKPFCNFRPKAFTIAASFISFGTPFVEKLRS
jgi:hypothetical protein